MAGHHEHHVGVEADGISSTVDDDCADERGQGLLDVNDRKAAKRERKRAKNQQRFNAITVEDLNRVQDALHPESLDASEDALYVPHGQGLIGDSTIDKNIAFNTHAFQYGNLRQGAHAEKFLRNKDPSSKVSIEDLDQILVTIMAVLGIKVTVPKATKERKGLITKLSAAIKKDLIAFENEQLETMERKAGYWRYANKRTYNQMVENNQLWDWATGQKLCKIEDESELGSVDEEDERAEEATMYSITPNDTPLTSPETGFIDMSTLNSIDYQKYDNDTDEFTDHTSNRSHSPFAEDFHIPPPTSDDQLPVPKAHIYDGQKDTRTDDGAIFVREASPRRQPPPNRNNNPGPQRTVLSPSIILPSSTDINNRFNNLDRELPAPCDDIKRKPKAASPAKIIAVRVVPRKMEALQKEEGWQVQGRPRKDLRGFPVLGGKNMKENVLLVKKVVAEGHALRLRPGGGGRLWADVVAGAVKR